MHICALPNRLYRFIAGAQSPVNNKEYQDGAETATAQFFCAVSGNDCFEKTVHACKVYSKVRINHAN
jgi:hypothetical protein